jgi:hypothetical protein
MGILPASPELAGRAQIVASPARYASGLPIKVQKNDETERSIPRAVFRDIEPSQKPTEAAYFVCPPEDGAGPEEPELEPLDMAEFPPVLAGPAREKEDGE